MSGPSERSWSDDPNAPQLPYLLYTPEKDYFTGATIGAVVYGVVIALFFQCMSALLHPVHRTKKGIKWGLVAHTVAMFSFLTISHTINRNIFSISYIDAREFSGTDDLPPGPIGYQAFVNSEVTSIVSTLMFPFNQWLADGLLLYRCYIICSMNYWAIAFPCLMYLASFVTGVLSLYQRLGRGNLTGVTEIVYFSISLSLNLLLTLMIIVRLVLHSRNIRKAIGASSGAHGLYAAVVTMLVESSALYATTFLLYMVPIATSSYVSYIFSAALGDTQVIAPFLIILRVANRSALTSEAVASGDDGSIHFRSGGGSMDSSATLPDGHPMSLIEADGETSGELGVGVEIEYLKT